MLLLLPPCFQAMDAAYQVLTRPSASCAATAAVQPPGRKLPRVCRGSRVRRQQSAHGSRMVLQSLLIAALLVIVYAMSQRTGALRDNISTERVKLHG